MEQKDFKQKAYNELSNELTEKLNKLEKDKIKQCKLDIELELYEKCNEKARSDDRRYYDRVCAEIDVELKAFKEENIDKQIDMVRYQISILNWMIEQEKSR